MTLKHLLSAVRELILDKEATPGSLENRQVEFAERFPYLDKTELDDLAAIKPDSMRVYNELIYNGEISMLRWIYPITFAVMARLKKISGDDQEGRKYFNGIVRELHQFRAWQSDSSRLLAANFQDFIVETKHDLQQAWPGLADIIDYEKTAVDVFYALDVPHQEMTVEQLEALSVGQLMDLPVFVPAFVALKKFQCDVVQLGLEWRNDDDIPDHLPAPLEIRAVCGRDVGTLMPRWLAIDHAAHFILHHLSGVEYLALNDVATLYLQQQLWRDGETEEAQFQRFFQELVAWFSAGVICVHKY